MLQQVIISGIVFLVLDYVRSKLFRRQALRQMGVDPDATQKQYQGGDESLTYFERAAKRIEHDPNSIDFVSDTVYRGKNTEHGPVYEPVHYCRFEFVEVPVTIEEHDDLYHLYKLRINEMENQSKRKTLRNL